MSTRRVSTRQVSTRPVPTRRVLLVLALAAGGVGRHVASLADGLRADGHQVTVAGPAASLEAFAFGASERVEITGRPGLVRDARSVARLRALARDADVVHAHGLRAGALAVAARGPVVVTLHNAVQGRVGAALERWVARRADVVLGASQDLVDRARALGARDARLAPVGAPPLARTGHDPGLGRPLVLAVGRIAPQKGYEVLVEALPHLVGAVVAVAGDGDEALHADLRRRAPGIHWLGRRDDVADLLAAADVVVLPSHWEARSLTAQEALRAGRPLVATAVGGTPELVQDGAVLVPAGDPEALGRAVRRLLDDPAAAAALGQRGRAVAADFPSEADTLAQVAALYAELVR